MLWEQCKDLNKQRYYLKKTVFSELKQGIKNYTKHSTEVHLWLTKTNCRRQKRHSTPGQVKHIFLA